MSALGHKQPLSSLSPERLVTARTGRSREASLGQDLPLDPAERESRAVPWRSGIIVTYRLKSSEFDLPN
jgi:hypothetical protein